MPYLTLGAVEGRGGIGKAVGAVADVAVGMMKAVGAVEAAGKAVVGGSRTVGRAVG
jgi:hypothetical protein